MRIFSVLIEEERETAEAKEEEFIKYLECIEEQGISQAQDNQFQMVINTEQKGKVCFRNVNPNMVFADNGMEYTMADLLIADQVIDRYIRDYRGSIRQFL